MNRAGRHDHPNNVSDYVGVDGRVFLTAEWQHLAMLNYEVDADCLLPFVPAGTEIDRWEGKVFISLVGFQFLKARLFGFLPIPLHSNFEEVNLRFYVRRREKDEFRRGVVFIREMVPRRAIAFVARTFYNENYVALPMAREIRSVDDDGLKVTYRWQSKKRWSEISLETDGAAELPVEGSVEQFITEHYWGYAAQPDGSCVEYRVTHPSWKVWQASASAFDGDMAEFYGEKIAAVLRRKPDSAFLAEGSAVTVMRGRRL
jgi:uncharacterized protein YqjF (DUF2071 family)